MFPHIRASYSGQARNPNRQLRFDHLELSPGQLHSAGSQRNVFSVSPLRLDQMPRLEGQQIANPELAHRDRNIEFHWKQGKRHA